MALFSCKGSRSNFCVLTRERKLGVTPCKSCGSQILCDESCCLFTVFGFFALPCCTRVKEMNGIRDGDLVLFALFSLLGCFSSYCFSVVRLLLCFPLSLCLVGFFWFFVLVTCSFLCISFFLPEESIPCLFRGWFLALLGVSPLLFILGCLTWLCLPCPLAPALLFLCLHLPDVLSPLIVLFCLFLSGFLNCSLLSGLSCRA